MLTTSFDCVVLDGTVVTAADVGRYDIGIKDGKIAILAPARSLAIARSSRVIDAEGAYVMVSFIHTESTVMVSITDTSLLARRH